MSPSAPDTPCTSLYAVLHDGSSFSRGSPAVQPSPAIPIRSREKQFSSEEYVTGAPLNSLDAFVGPDPVRVEISSRREKQYIHDDPQTHHA